MYNSTIIQLEQDIINAINKSGLHIGTIALIVDKINTLVKDSFEEQAKKERKEKLEAEQQNNLSDMSDMIEIDNSLID